MDRIARIVVPGYPHHITQRGNRRQQTFFNNENYQAYIELMSHWCREHSVDSWGYCQMPNHVHLIAVSSDESPREMAMEQCSGTHIQSKR